MATHGKVYTIDARKVSEEALGKYFPNTPMLAAIVKVSGIMSDEDFKAVVGDFGFVKSSSWNNGPYST